MRTNHFAPFLFLSAAALNAQSLTGDILGTIFDASQAVVVSAKVQVASLAQGWTRETQSDEYGNYIFTKLAPGPYKLTFSSPGFRTQIVPSVELAVDQKARVNTTLQPGEVTEQVTVEAGAVPLLSTDSNVIGQVYDSRKITTLPLNGRRFFDLALLTTGAAPQGSTFSSVVWGRPTGVSLAGTRDINVGFLIDGSETRDERYGGTFQFSSVESIKEFKVQENFVDAQYGQAAALVTAVTASGTNSFHGSLYHFLRNNALDARNFFDGARRPPFRFNQFGGSIGGPVLLPKVNGRDKSWFFFNYEGQRRRRTTTRIATVPTERMQGGDLGEIPRIIYDPVSGSAATGRRTAFPNNVIPVNRINPVSRNLLPFWRRPNAAGLGNNYITTATDIDDYDQITGRWDHNATANDRLMTRYSYIDQPTLRGDYAPIAGRVAPLRNNNALIQYTRIVSPKAVNEFRFSYHRSAAQFAQEPQSENLAARIGLRNTSTDPAEFGLPSVSVAGYSGFGSFSPTISNITDRFQWADDFTYTSGKHNLKAGIDLRRVRYRQRSAQSPRGFIQYTGANFSNPGPGIGGGGDALADYLIGVPGFWQVQLEELGFDGRSTQPGIYFQDDFKVSKRLSLTLGVRWEYNSPWVQPRNNMAVFNFQSRQLEYALKDPFAFRTSTEAGGNVSRSIINKQLNNWADRIGLVYRFDEKTVIRMGHGYYWNNVNNNQLTQSMSLFYPFVWNPQQTESTTQIVPSRFVDNLYPDRPTGRDLPSGPSFSFATVQKTYRRPYTGQWNFNIQRTLGQNYVAEIGYMGNISMKMPAASNFNQARLPDPNIPFQNQPIQSRRPYPEYGTIRQFDRMGKARYHALTSKIEKRFSAGFSFLGSYTWSKALDTGRDISSDPIKQPGDANSYRGRADLDTGHRFVASYQFELPFGRGKRFLSGTNRAANAALGGWQINGITTYQLGTPISVTAPSAIPDVDAFAVFANRTCDGRLPRGERTRLRWFDTSCFSLPSPGNFGTAGRGILRAPGIANWDISMFKRFDFSEGRQLQLRWEFFNAWNHTQFGAPASGLPSPVFGVINSAQTPRNIQVAGRFSF
ncbi:MAG: TonB-dependent receptor [Acidobacteria bacterium]|nr:TonB-dependent receptor [Acidobacteriota bacterium]